MARREGHIEEVRGADGRQRRNRQGLAWRVEVPTDPRPGQTRGRLRRTVYGTRKEAQAELRALFAVRDHDTEPVERLTVAQLADRWLAANARRWKPSTMALYKRHLDLYILPRLGGKPVRAVKPDDLNRMYADASNQGARKPALSATYVRSTHRTAQAMFSYAVEIEAAARNPVSNARPPKARKTRREPIPDQVVADVLAAGDVRDQALLRVHAVTGARPNEVCALRWPDLHLDDTPPHIAFGRGLSSGLDPQTLRPVEAVEGPTKTDEDEPRRVVVDADTVEVLRRWRVQRLEQSLVTAGASFADRGFVFTGKRDKGEGSVPMNPGTAADVFSRTLVRLGFEPRRWSVYDLRRWSATAAGEGGASLRSVMDRLGHTQASTTLIYQQARLGPDVTIAEGLGRRLRT